MAPWRSTTDGSSSRTRRRPSSVPTRGPTSTTGGPGVVSCRSVGSGSRRPGRTRASHSTPPGPAGSSRRTSALPPVVLTRSRRAGQHGGVVDDQRRRPGRAGREDRPWWRGRPPRCRPGPGPRAVGPRCGVRPAVGRWPLRAARSHRRPSPSPRRDRSGVGSPRAGAGRWRSARSDMGTMVAEPGPRPRRTVVGARSRGGPDGRSCAVVGITEEHPDRGGMRGTIRGIVTEEIARCPATRRLQRSPTHPRPERLSLRSAVTSP